MKPFYFHFSGMYKKKDTGKCEFCPPKTYSNGTLTECLPCANDLSLLPGLYYKHWNDLPIYLNRSYMSFHDSKTCMSNDFLSFVFNKYFFYLFKRTNLVQVIAGLVLVY